MNRNREMGLARTLLRAVVDATGLSRRAAFGAIRDGRVTVDGEPARDPSAACNEGRLELDGHELEQKPREPVYLMLNKPPGLLTTRSDERGRATVFDLLPDELRSVGLHPVGRLDRDTSGLLLLTNDGDLTYRLTHPKHEVEKEYWVGLARPASESQLTALRAGVEIDGRLVAPRRLKRIAGPSGFELSITIVEGRKHQVRRMLDSVGARVVRLRRVREGRLTVGRLREGGFRRLTQPEVVSLYAGPGSPPR